MALPETIAKSLATKLFFGLQNCVYHLKRKHKVVCDSVDQYMAAGLVIFKGASHPTGLTEARPKSDASS
jgi:hypothetical protein